MKNEQSPEKIINSYKKSGNFGGKNDISALLALLSDGEKRKLNELLRDKAALKRVLTSPEAEKIMRDLDVTGGK